MNNYFKFPVLTAVLLLLIVSPISKAKNTTPNPIKPQIVGGELASQGDWPWMSALVFTFNDIATSLTVNNTSYESQSFSGGFAGNASGELVDCGLGDSQCLEASNKICLIERGDINFSVKVENCQAGGGVGAIIYNNVEGTINGTLGDDFTGTIPAVAITQAVGLSLKNSIGSNASISVAESPALVQSASCGASFLGNKWLLTAAHCVDGVSSSQLKVNVGEYDLSDGAENAQNVKQIYIHADYQVGGELNNDIAIIELVNAVDNPSVTLLDENQTNILAMENSIATVTGWGGREGYEAGGGPTSNFPDVLHQVDLQLMTNEACKDTFAQSLTIFNGQATSPDDVGITNAMICAAVAGGGKGSCQGDSGGPLMVNTNEGWQQIGIVSWGIGCADDGYPGVYTRAAIFSDWIKEITQGIAIEQSADLGIHAQNNPITTELSIDNNSDLSAGLTFTLEGDTSFTLDASACNTLAAGASCLLKVNYDTAQVGKHNASIIISSDNNDIPTSSSQISAQTIALASAIQNQLSGSDNTLTWYSGGDLPWQLDNTQAAIVSGAINNNQETAVMVTLTGAGELSFDWSVSSEENTGDPASPYDALYVYLDDELITFISGEVEFTSETLSFADGEHRITWLYSKDPLTTEGEDKARLKNVVFTPAAVVTPTPPSPTPTPPTSTSSGGGSVTWLSLLLIAVVRLYRK